MSERKCPNGCGQMQSVPTESRLAEFRCDECGQREYEKREVMSGASGKAEDGVDNTAARHLSLQEECRIPFIQYLLPDGRKKDVWIVRPWATAEVARILREERGCRFEIEMLTTGQISMTCERDDDEGETEVVAMEVCSNGPDVPLRVDKLVADAAEEIGI